MKTSTIFEIAKWIVIIVCAFIGYYTTKA